VANLCWSVQLFELSELCRPDIRKPRDAGTSGGQGAEKKLRAMQTYEKQKKSLATIMLVTRRGAGGLVSHEKIFPFPGKMCWT